MAQAALWGRSRSHTFGCKTCEAVADEGPGGGGEGGVPVSNVAAEDGGRSVWGPGLGSAATFSEFRMRFQLWNVIQESRLFGLLRLYLLDWSKEKQKFSSRFVRNTRQTNRADLTPTDRNDNFNKPRR